MYQSTTAKDLYRGTRGNRNGGCGGGAGEAWAQVSTKSNSQICEKRRKGASKHTTNKKGINKEGGRNRGDEKKATDRPMKGDPPG